MATTKKAGRPARSKESYQREVQALKATVKAQEKTIDDLVILTDGQYKKLYRYQFPTFKQRVKYLIEGDL